MFVLQPVVWTS